jgi:hypothetical protein
MSSHAYPFGWMQPPDTLLADLISKLESDPSSVTTKDCLKPVFKWLKFGCKHYAPEKSFQFAEWIVQLRYVCISTALMSTV